MDSQYYYSEYMFLKLIAGVSSVGCSGCSGCSGRGACFVLICLVVFPIGNDCSSIIIIVGSSVGCSIGCYIGCSICGTSTMLFIGSSSCSICGLSTMLFIGCSIN